MFEACEAHSGILFGVRLPTAKSSHDARCGTGHQGAGEDRRSAEIKAVYHANGYFQQEATRSWRCPKTTTRNGRFDIWVVGYRQPAGPGARLDGGGLVVTNDGGVYDLSSAPGSLDEMMMESELWPGAQLSDVFSRAGDAEGKRRYGSAMQSKTTGFVVALVVVGGVFATVLQIFSSAADVAREYWWCGWASRVLRPRGCCVPGG